MSDTEKNLKRSLGIPFWVGLIVTPILLLVLLSALGCFGDSFSFWLFVCVVPPIFGPFGGMFFQAINDLLVAGRLKLIRIREVVLLVVIFLIFLLAGYISLHTPGKDRIPEIAGAIVAVLIFIYAKRKV